jgi:hypothetical protein
VASGPPPKVPSVTGYVLAGLLTLAGIAGGVLLIVSGIRTYVDKVEGFERFEAPDSRALDLGEGGYSIYFERPGLDDDDPFPPISVSVVDPEGEPVDLDRYDTDVSYSVSGHDGRGAWTFDADDPGTYRIQADGSGGDVAVGRGIGARFAGAVVAGVGMLLLAPVLGAIVAVVTFLRRSKAKRARQAAWQQQPPQWGWTR